MILTTSSLLTAAVDGAHELLMMASMAFASMMMLMIGKMEKADAQSGRKAESGLSPYLTVLNGST